MPHHTRRTLLSASSLGLATLGANALGLSRPFIRPAEAASTISFRLDWSIYGSHCPFYLAQHEKLFQKAGLNVTIGEGSGSGTSSRLVGNGGDQFGFIDFGSMIFAVAGGIGLIGLQRVISNNMCIVSHEDAPVKTPQELEGKVIAYAPSESTGQMMPALYKVNKVDPSKVSILSPAAMAKNALFLQRRADCIPVSLNVQPAQLEAQGAKLTRFMFSDFGVRLMNNGIVGNAAWVKANPDAAKAFLHVVAEAFAMAQKEPARAVDALVAELPQQERNKSVLARQLELTFPLLTTSATEGKPFGTMADADWTSTQDLLADYGGLQKKTPVEQLYTNSLLPA